MLQPVYPRALGRITRPAFNGIQDESKILKQQPKPHVELEGLRGWWMLRNKSNVRNVGIRTVDEKTGHHRITCSPVDRRVT
ncbi:unnamed protein product [Angiostrongylus costaricensis]|uniref:Transposase n=1 Tax=Angiostrongylus costaricensis TaxID=334426 RepID=A0A0R3PV44_ANGCS|nr:unnamed protein product [Angiostrongylus costaricensis]